VLTLESLTDAIEEAKRGNESMVKCPAHDDRAASLHVKRGDTQPVIMFCHARCETSAIIEASGIDPQILMAERDPSETRVQGEWTPVRDEQGNYLNASDVYPYYDEQGQLLFEVLRVPMPGGKKTFRQRHPDPTKPKGYAWNMEGVRRVLYRLPEVLEAKAGGRVIYLVEGEKDVETLRSHGEVATTSPMGAGKWQESFGESLAEAIVVIIPDADNTGRAHARQVRDSLLEHNCTVSIKEPKAGKDVTDHFAAGFTLADLMETVPEQEEGGESFGLDILEAIKRDVKPSSFVIPNVLAEGDRLLITGFEGHGKSTLCRQLAVQVAAGIHPWSLQDVEPQKVLVVDSENHPDQVLESWTNMIGKAARHGRPVLPGMLMLQEEWDNEINIDGDEGAQWLIERIRAHRPRLCVIGPLYNLAAKDLSEHAVVGRMKQVINEARGICGTAFIMEHHAPHRGPGDKERSVRPYGSSTFLKWPDFGYGLKPTEQEGVYEWQKTRFPRVRSRNFPTHLRWGKPNTLEWDWMPAAEDAAGNII
jgi:5S rRNA maturation endonuclease (ribonuclease M5)